MREEEGKTLTQPAGSLGNGSTMKTRILIVDDDKAVRETISEVLSQSGFECLMAPDGEKALLLYAQERALIHLVILDWAMPGLDGADTFRRLREINPEVRAILMSGYQYSEEIEILVAEGVKAFLSKPFQIEELIQIVRAAMEL